MVRQSHPAAMGRSTGSGTQRLSSLSCLPASKSAAGDTACQRHLRNCDEQYAVGMSTSSSCICPRTYETPHPRGAYLLSDSVVHQSRRTAMGYWRHSDSCRAAQQDWPQSRASPPRRARPYQRAPTQGLCRGQNFACSARQRADRSAGNARDCRHSSGANCSRAPSPHRGTARADKNGRRVFVVAARLFLMHFAVIDAVAAEAIAAASARSP